MLRIDDLFAEHFDRDFLSCFLVDALVDLCVGSLSDLVFGVKKIFVDALIRHRNKLNLFIIGRVVGDFDI